MVHITDEISKNEVELWRFSGFGREFQVSDRRTSRIDTSSNAGKRGWLYSPVFFDTEKLRPKPEK